MSLDRCKGCGAAAGHTHLRCPYFDDGTMYGGRITMLDVVKGLPATTPNPSEATACVVNERGATYGHPKEDFDRTASLWNALLAGRLKEGVSLTAVDVAQFMRMVKESRLVKTPNHYDSLLDICGYADCHHMVNEAEQKILKITA